MFYLLVFVTTLSGWSYASARGWSLAFFGLFSLPHESIVWVLLGVIAIHAAAAVLHAFVYRDHFMQRMLFQAPASRR